MIARHWTGLTRKDSANDYIAHLKNDTFKQLTGIKGFLKASIESREIDDGVEFLIVTQWESFDAIKQFAGKDFETAVVPELVQEMMIHYDKKVKHYEIKHITRNHS